MATGPDRFSRFAAIDWSGAKGARHPGIALAVAEAGDAAPRLIEPGGGAWSRGAILHWVREQAETPTLIGFDFSFAPPLIERGAYLPGEDAPATARAFWAWLDAHCMDADLGAASFLEAHRGRHFYLGAVDGMKARFMHFRRCEAHYNAGGGGKPSTVYDAIGAAQVAKASFAGMRLLHHLGRAVPVWPFDPVPDRGALVVEIYTAIAARAAGLRKGRSKLRDLAALNAALAELGSGAFTATGPLSDHQSDVLMAAAWLRVRAGEASLWRPAPLTPAIARSEGWTFGVA